MKTIYIYGPDGSGKTFIATELQKKLKRSVIIPFEPGKFGSLVKEIDSGFNGENSALVNSISLWKSTLFFIRYILRFVMFKIRYSRNFDYAIFTRGPIEFGINDTHKNFPKKIGRIFQRIISKNVLIVIRPVNTILKQKPELPRLRILQLYEEYILSGCKPIVNIDKSLCVKNILQRIK